MFRPKPFPQDCECGVIASYNGTEVAVAACREGQMELVDPVLWRPVGSTSPGQLYTVTIKLVSQQGGSLVDEYR